MAKVAPGNERFNAMAAAWDSSPDVHRASESALQAILRYLGGNAVETKELDVLEIGCGTGLLTLRLALHVRRIVAVDAAQGMIDVLEQKLAGPYADMKDKVQPLSLLLTDPEDPALPAADRADGPDDSKPRRKFDLIISHLVLHHIPDHPALLKTIYGCLKPGGKLALTDYENFGPEAKRFHPQGKMDGVVFHGIEAYLFAEQMIAAGFVDVDVRAEWTMDKHVERFPGEWDNRKPKDTSLLDKMQFPFLLCRGARPS